MSDKLKPPVVIDPNSPADSLVDDGAVFDATLTEEALEQPAPAPAPPAPAAPPELTRAERAAQKASQLLEFVSLKRTDVQQRELVRPDNWLPYLRSANLSFQQIQVWNREFQDQLFLKAFQAGNLIIAEHLLAECWVNIREDNLLTEHGSVMHAAVAANNADALIILMRRASNATNYKNRDGLTPLALAIKLRRKDMVVFFLKEGVAIDRQAVMEAIKLGDLDLLQRFAKRKVDVFCYLVESKRNDLISSLLNKPVSVSLKAVFVAVDNNNLQALQLFHHKGVPVFFSVGIKHSPLVRAIRNKNIRLVDFYVDLLRPNKASEGAVLNLNLMQYFSASLKKPHLYQLYLVSQLRHDQGAMRKVEKLLSGCKSAEPLEKVKHLFKCYLKGRRLGLRFLCSVVPRLFAGKIALLAGKLDSGEIASVEELSEKMTEVFFSESVNHHAVEADDLLMPMLAYIRVNLIKAPAAHLTPAAAI